MAEIISIETLVPAHEINVTRIKRKVNPDTLQPSTEETTVEIASEHTAEPIKSTETIKQISQYLIEHERYRDNMLFIVGINFGLRVSDLLQLRYFMLIDNDYTFRNSFPILEKKTKNTRKVKKNRYITINDAVIEAVTLYLEHNHCKMDDYLFRSESNRGGNLNKPMSRISVDRILKGIAEEVGLTEKISTHTLRKTFGYHQMVMSGNDPRKLLLLQKIFGHSSAAQTLAYIGITQEEISDAYNQMNLGGRNVYTTYNRIGESQVV